MNTPLDPTDASEFTRRVFAHCLGDGDDLTYEDFIDLAEELGLVASVAYDPDVHGEIDDAKEGDPVVIQTFNDRDADRDAE